MGSERRWNKRAPRGHRKSLAIRPREPSGLRSSDPRPSAPTEHPFVLDANRYTWLREQTKSGRGMLQRSTFFSLFFFLSFRPCISRDSKIPLEFLPFPRLIGQFIWLSWSGVNWLIELMNFNQNCEREIDGILFVWDKNFNRNESLSKFSKFSFSKPRNTLGISK